MKRNLNDKVIGGVCSGIADELETKSSLIRLLFIITFWFFGIGPILYLILWIIFPGELIVNSQSEECEGDNCNIVNCCGKNVEKEENN